MDAQSAKRIGAVIATNQESILEGWATAVRETLRGRMTRTELGRQLEEIALGLRAALDAGASAADGPESAELRAQLTDLSRTRARHGFSATETAVSIFAIKEAVLSALPDRDPQSLADYAQFSGYIDGLGLLAFETYVSARESLITEQAEQLLELSTPVVKLWDGVVAVPLIGTLDSARSQVVMERLLQALVESGSPYAILDITGVPSVDTQVAQHILKTVMAAQLMGAQCIISGIRPQIAQTIVSLGIEFGDIETKATLADALQSALRHSGVEIVKRSTRPVQ